jgi:hypothetical protein
LSLSKDTFNVAPAFNSYSSVHVAAPVLKAIKHELEAEILVMIIVLKNLATPAPVADHITRCLVLASKVMVHVSGL